MRPSPTSDTDHVATMLSIKRRCFTIIINALNSDRRPSENDLAAFKTYLEAERAKGPAGPPLQEAVSGVQYTYNSEFLVYTQNVDGTIIQSDTQQLLQELLVEYFGMDISSMLHLGEEYGFMGSSAMSSMSFGGTSAVLWQQMLAGDDGALINPLLKGQYDLVYGSWPTAYNEIVLVLDENNELDDMTLYALGLKAKEEVDAMAQAALDKEQVAPTSEHWSYQEICDMDFRTVFPADCYSYDAATGLYTDLRTTQAGMKYLYDNGLSLKVTGIIRPSEDAVSTMLTGSIGYTAALTEYLIDHTSGAPALEAQLEAPQRDIFTGLPFQENTGSLSDAEKETAFRDYIAALAEAQQAEVVFEDPEYPQPGAAGQRRRPGSERHGPGRPGGDALPGADPADECRSRAAAAIHRRHVRRRDAAALRPNHPGADDGPIRRPGPAAAGRAEPAAKGRGAPGRAAGLYNSQQCAQYYDQVLEFSDSTYEANLEKLGYVDLDDPASISLYAASFDAKEQIEDAIAAYNDAVDDLEKISYTDYVGLMMSSVTTIINAITYVLIAFVAVSLIVSSIMIGVITLISVQERTKEIGILRSIGASKKNVSSMFTAETVLIGFAAGALGVLITYLLCIPINLILHHVTGIVNLRAYLPVPVALALVVISMLLTLLAGMIPSRSAAKKDPVVALRTE